MAYKTCGHCQEQNGVRAHRCKSCANPFPVRAAQELLPAAKIVPIVKGKRRFKSVDWRALRKNDRIIVKARSGPHYTDDYGNTRYITGGGIFRVLSIDDSGLHVRGEGKGACGFQFLFMGKTGPSPLCNTLIREPHKIKLIL